MKQILFLTVLLLSNSILFSQQIQTIHQEEAEKYSHFNFKSEAQWDSLNNFQAKNKTPKKITNKNLEKEVFGWNAYWTGTAYYDYDYSLLSEVSYFSCVVNENTGEPETIHSWKTTEIVDYAHAAGTRVSLTATLFSNHDVFFENPTSVETLIDTLIELVKYRNADGVNIDFEAVSSSQSENLTNFMIELSNRFHTEIPGSTVSIALPAVDWSSVFDVEAMNPYVDLFIIMGYGYHWSGGTTPGPGSPKNSGEIWTSINTTRSINTYIEVGISPEKLCLGVPYYSRDWKTEDNTIPGTPLENGVAQTYRQVRENYSEYTMKWDTHSSTPYYVYQDASSWHQCWHNEEVSLGLKYDMVKMQNIAGIGIWALGYDEGYTELYDILKEKFSDQGNEYYAGTFTDMGGKKQNYYDDENYTFTIAPKNTDEIKLVFDEFHVEQDYDTLFIYDGENTEADLINFYTGEHTIEDTITTSTGTVTFKFYSDGATTEKGWIIRWSCNNFTNISENSYTTNNIIKIYPNPFTNELFSNITIQKEEEINITILNNTFQVLSEKKINLPKGTHNIPINNLNTSLKTGIYFIRIRIGNQSYTEKIIKI